MAVAKKVLAATSFLDGFGSIPNIDDLLASRGPQHFGWRVLLTINVAYCVYNLLRILFLFIAVSPSEDDLLAVLVAFTWYATLLAGTLIANIK